MLMKLNKQFTKEDSVPGYQLEHTGYSAAYYNLMVATFGLGILYDLAMEREARNDERIQGLLRLPGTEADLVCTREQLAALANHLNGVADDIVKSLFVEATTSLTYSQPVAVVKALGAMAKTGVGITVVTPEIKFYVANRLRETLAKVQPHLPMLPIEEACAFAERMTRETFMPLRHGVIM